MTEKEWLRGANYEWLAARKDEHERRAVAAAPHVPHGTSRNVCCERSGKSERRVGVAGVGRPVVWA
jgi:hypothetical protein